LRVVVSKDHDVHIFEELPLHIQMRIIEDHEVVSTKDMYGMHEYFYNYRKLWEDQKHDDWRWIESQPSFFGEDVWYLDGIL